MRDQADRGLVMVNTGQGKGKTTAALGAALRAAGQGLEVLVLQFIKSGRGYGETAAMRRLGVAMEGLGLGLIRPGDDLAPHREAAKRAWQRARAEAASGRWDLLVLDELCPALQRGFVAMAEVRELLASRPPGLHLIITGRNCPPELLDLADTVTEMRAVRHHLDAGVPAQEGIEY